MALDEKIVLNGNYLLEKTVFPTITNVFQKHVDDSGHKANKIWPGKDREFCNRSRKSWLQDNNIKMYSTHNNGKIAIAGEFIRTLIKIYKHMTYI